MVKQLHRLPNINPHPARTVATMPARTARDIHDRKMDALLRAPKLMRLPNYDIAFNRTADRLHGLRAGLTGSA